MKNFDTKSQNFNYDKATCHDAIKFICEEVLYDNRNPNHSYAQHLFNAATIMMYDKDEQYVDIMNMMFKMLCDQKLEVVENKMKEIMQQRGIDSKKFLIETKLEVDARQLQG